MSQDWEKHSTPMLRILRRHALRICCDPNRKKQHENATKYLDAINLELDRRLGERRYAVRNERNLDTY